MALRYGRPLAVPLSARFQGGHTPKPMPLEVAETLRLRALEKKYERPFKLWPGDRHKVVAKYAEARMLTKATGVKHEVDHIVPLSGPDVCGLHVSWNLRVITQQENQEKGDGRAPLTV